jgi:hypothetical protein
VSYPLERAAPIRRPALAMMKATSARAGCTVRAVSLWGGLACELPNQARRDRDNGVAPRRTVSVFEDVRTELESPT